MKNEKQETCCHLAAKQGNLKCLKIVFTFRECRPLKLASDKDDHGMTVLHFSALSGREDMVMWLAEEFGKDLCGVVNTLGQTALHLASMKGTVVIRYNLQLFT